jgi:DNA-binding CsgD family transcriptional regulator
VGQVAGRTIGGRPDIVGREPERDRLAAFVDAVPNGARALVIRGEPGIGKTALWRLGVQQCEAAQYTVLTTRAAEEEMRLGLTGLVDLFEAVDVDAGALAAGDDAFARGRAVLTALRDLSREHPVLMAIDDLQWLDQPSARALRYALRRLDDEPVGLLATLLLMPDGDDPLAPASTLPPGRSDALLLGPLGLESLRRLLSQTVTAISRPMLQRIHEVSGGNPLYAIELARGLADDERRATHPGGLPLPDSVQAAIAYRLESVTPEVVGLLEAVSALGNTSVRELRQALPHVETDALLGQAEQLGLLVVEEDLRVRFVHPLVGSAVYNAMSPLVRRDLHARLAAAAVDDDVRARHLALCTDGPDATVAALLEEAAARARAREAFDLAGDFAGHSVRLTPAGDAGAALRRALAEIDDRAIAGELSRALALADGLVASLPPGPERCQALLERAYLEDDDIAAGVALMRQALADAGNDDMLRGRVLDHLGWALAMFAGDLPSGLACKREAVTVSDRVGDELMQMSTTAFLAYLEALNGTPRPELMARAVALEPRSGRPLMWTSPRTLHAEILFWDGDLAGARSLFEEVRDEAARAGTKVHHPYSMFDLALVACAAGRLADAEELVREGIEAARDAEDTWGERLLLYPLALTNAWLGRGDHAREIAQRRLDEAAAKGERPGIVRARGVLGLLALSEGDSAAAARELREGAELVEAIGYQHPGAFPVLPDAIEALASSGDPVAAEELLARLERQAAAVDSAWALAACDRARGATLLARGAADDAAEPLERAGASFDRLGYRPDAARATLLRGRALLRGGHRTRASDALADAHDRFAAMGAALWEARAIEDLERAAPGRALGALTPAERRIAALVAQGLKNREIGQTLFMSVGTVEAHLTRTYRKLGIRSRSELARWVAEGGVD